MKIVALLILIAVGAIGALVPNSLRAHAQNEAKGTHQAALPAPKIQHVGIR